MIDENTTPPVGRSIEKRLREIHAAKPDPWTMAWIKNSFDEVRKAYQGVCHWVNMLVATMREHEDRMKALETENAALRERQELLEAGIGEANVEIGALRKRFEEMSVWATKVNKKIKVDGKSDGD